MSRSEETGHPMLSSLPPSRMKKGKVVSAHEAIRLIRDGDTIATGGFVGIGFPEKIAIEVENYFLENGKPRNLTLLYAAGQGDGQTRGLNHFAHDGLVCRVIGGHWGLAPKLQKMAIENKIEAYNLPQGVISHMYRDIAAHKPRTITSVGLGTFVDPRNGGGKINTKTQTDIVELICFDGQEYLAYKPLPINVAILRGTTGDLDGNITMEKEALTLEALAIATAAKNSGGVVIVQVERIAERGTLNARQVKIPGILVDCVVTASAEHHWQTFEQVYNPAFSSEIRVPMHAIATMSMSPRKIISRRAAFELKANSIINLGIGMPEGIASVANEEKVLDYITMTAEPGVIGGVPAGGLNFGAAVNTEAVIDQPSQFDFYDGGGLDIAFLGLAQADAQGNLNVSKFGTRLAGAGGFINISQNAKKVIFVGTFTTGGLEVAVENDKLNIRKEGRVKKFIQQVEHVTFSGQVATQKNQSVMYITERCVFKLCDAGLELIEIAPGIDLQKNILDLMEFTPVIRRAPKLMDDRILWSEAMGLKEDLLSLSLDERLTYDRAENLFFVNFENYLVKTADDVREIREMVETMLAPLDRKVITIVNYDNFLIYPDIVDQYTEMVKGLVERFYARVTRYTTSAFLRMKLGDALQQRNVSPHIYETREMAHQALKLERNTALEKGCSSS